jgi:gluconolactonase
MQYKHRMSPNTVWSIGVSLLATLAVPALSLQAQQQPVREVTVTEIPGVIAGGATWSLVWQGTDNADGIVGTVDGGLLFAQEQPQRVSKLDKTDKVSVLAEDTHGAGSLALDARGRIIAVQRTCTDPGLNAPCSEPTKIGIVYPAKERKLLADNFNGKPFGRLNDLVVDSNGGVYFTVGGAYHASPEGIVSSIGENLRTNGIMLSPDETTLYVTNGPVVVAFDVQPDGLVRNQRDFAKLEAGGSGDGMAVDGSGRLYVASNPGVQVFSPDGKYLGLIQTPRSVISVAFSGPDKKTLYVVGSGALDEAGKEVTTPPGVRNNAKSIFKIPMLAQGFKGRAK